MWSVETSPDCRRWTREGGQFNHYVFADILFNFIVDCKMGGFIRLVDDETGIVHERARIEGFLLDK